MAVTTRGCKQTIDRTMLSVVEGEMRKDKDVVEASEELFDKTTKEEEVHKKVVPFLHLHHHSLRY